MKKSNFVGRKFTITPGTRVRVGGVNKVQNKHSTVTVRAQEKTNTGKIRVVWKSMGYRASTVITA